MKKFEKTISIGLFDSSDIVDDTLPSCGQWCCRKGKRLTSKGESQNSLGDHCGFLSRGE